MEIIEKNKYKLPKKVVRELTLELTKLLIEKGIEESQKELEYINNTTVKDEQELLNDFLNTLYKVKQFFNTTYKFNLNNFNKLDGIGYSDFQISFKFYNTNPINTISEHYRPKTLYVIIKSKNYISDVLLEHFRNLFLEIFPDYGFRKIYTDYIDLRNKEKEDLNKIDLKFIKTIIE